MSPVSTVPPASRLQKDILRTILYFDIFHHPLRVDEIYRYLPSNSTSPAEIAAACRVVPLREVLREENGFVFLGERKNGNDPVAERLAKEDRARTYWRVARMVASIIRRFPFVRGVFVSGELSKGVASPHGDIDFFVVTAPRRLWIARTLLIFFKKTFLLNKKKFLCLNHFVTESYFDVEERNIYTALEIATLIPLYNHTLLQEYLRHNSWVSDLLPNVFVRAARSECPPRSSILQRILELPMRGGWADRFDELLMRFWKSTWDRRYGQVPPEKRSSLFRCTRDISTAYAGDFLSRILEEYKERLAAHGLDGAAN